MKSITYLVLTTAVLLSPAANAQQSTTALETRTIVQPGTEIDHYTFPPGISINAVAISDSGDWAFVAQSPKSGGGTYPVVFTSRRMVVAEGDQVDGKFITAIPKGAGLSINDDGHVAYEAEYVDDLRDLYEGKPHRGIFIDNHFALKLGDNADLTDFKLTNEGFVISESYFRTFHSRKDAFPQIRKNGQGQFLLPVNLSPQGFLLLLVSPVTH
jgi:hypothetical protein